MVVDICKSQLCLLTCLNKKSCTVTVTSGYHSTLNNRAKVLKNEEGGKTEPKRRCECSLSGYPRFLFLRKVNLHCLSHPRFKLLRNVSFPLTLIKQSLPWWSQWLRLHAPKAGGPDSNTDLGTRSHRLQLKTPHVTSKTWHSQKNKLIN